jgi:hypothetical protein
VSRRVTGWVLAGFALTAALVVAVLWRLDGGVDGWLAAVVSGGVLLALGIVAADARRGRRRDHPPGAP